MSGKPRRSELGKPEFINDHRLGTIVLYYYLCTGLTRLLKLVEK